MWLIDDGVIVVDGSDLREDVIPKTLRDPFPNVPNRKAGGHELLYNSNLGSKDAYRVGQPGRERLNGVHAGLVYLDIVQTSQHL